MLSGYDSEPGNVLDVTFAADCEEMITLRSIPFHSTCEHHLLPFSGVVHISYIPSDGRVVGISKLARLVEGYARRLQLQERLSTQIADALDSRLHPLGVAVMVEATHLCMVCRGVRKTGTTMRTTALRGVFRDKPEARMEFLNGVTSS